MKNNIILKSIVTLWVLAINLTLQAQTADDYFSKALDLEEQLQFDKALHFYTLAIELEPNNPVFLYNRGSVFMNLDSLGNALVDLNRALNLDTSLADAYYNRSLIHHHMNQNVMALEDMKHYVSMQPHDTMGLLSLAEFYFLEGDYTQCLKYNTRATEEGLQRKHIALKNQGVCYRMLNNPSMAEYLFSLAINAYPAYDWAYLERAKARIEMEEYSDALSDLYSFLMAQPQNKVGLELRSLALFNLKNYHLALQDYETLIEIEPHNPNWKLEKAHCFVKLSRDLEAELIYTSLLNEYTEASELGFIYLMRGISLFNQNKKTEACEDWFNARELKNEEAVVLLNRHCN